MRGRPRRVVPLAALVEVSAGASVYAVSRKRDLGYGTLWRECKAHDIPLRPKTSPAAIQKSRRCADEQV